MRMSDEYGETMEEEFPAYPRYSRNRAFLLFIVIGIFASALVILLYLHIDLQTKYRRLDDDYLELNSEFLNLKSLQDSLFLRIGRLESNLTSLRESYDQLLANYRVSETLRISHLLEDYYDEVRSLNTDVPGGGRSQDYEEDARFMADLAKHSLGRKYWPSLENRYYELSGEHSYATAMRKLDEVYALIAIEPRDTPIERIEKILLFVNENVYYERDYDNVFLAPLETLAFSSGDCDDYTILVATLFEKAGMNSGVGIFTNGTIDHAMVLLHSDTLSSYGFRFYQDLTSMGLSAGEWIIIEPQATIDRQYDLDWFNQWRIQAAADV